MQIVFAGPVAEQEIRNCHKAVGVYRTCHRGGHISDHLGARPVRTGPGLSNVTVTVNPNAQISSNNLNAVSLGDNANIAIGTNAPVQNSATTNGCGNTVEFGSNGTLAIQTGGQILSTGTATNAEAINVHGFGNGGTSDVNFINRTGARVEGNLTFGGVTTNSSSKRDRSLPACHPMRRSIFRATTKLWPV